MKDILEIGWEKAGMFHNPMEINPENDARIQIVWFNSDYSDPIFYEARNLIRAGTGSKISRKIRSNNIFFFDILNQ